MPTDKLTELSRIKLMDGLVQERRNSIANAQELRLCCTNPSKYCCYTKRGGVITNWPPEIIAGMLLICQNTTVRVYGAWIIIYYALCSKTYSNSAKVLWSTASSRQAVRSARICEIRLLKLRAPAFVKLAC